MRIENLLVCSVLSINNNGSSTSINYKPTDSHHYLLHFCPLIHHTQKMPFHSLNLLDEGAFVVMTPTSTKKAGKWASFSKKHSYPDSAVIPGKYRAQEIDQDTALQTSQNEVNNRIPFILTYHPQNLAVKNIILKNFKILCNDPETKHIFPLPPLISFKCDKNMGNILVRSTFQSDNQPGTFTCKCTWCKTCPLSSNTVTISGLNWSPKITDHFTCISTNVIYCIICTLRKKIYIGETGRGLVDHFPKTPKRCRKKNNTDTVRPNQLHAILIFLITLTTTWLFAGYPYTRGTQKAAKISNKNSSFNWVHSILTGSMNTSHSTNLFTNWRGVWNKALSDFSCNVKFSSSVTTEYKEIWKENLVIYQKSLEAFLQAPLQLRIDLICCDSVWFVVSSILVKQLHLTKFIET